MPKVRVISAKELDILNRLYENAANPPHSILCFRAAWTLKSLEKWPKVMALIRKLNKED